MESDLDKKTKSKVNNDDIKPINIHYQTSNEFSDNKEIKSFKNLDELILIFFKKRNIEINEESELPLKVIKILSNQHYEKDYLKGFKFYEKRNYYKKEKDTICIVRKVKKKENLFAYIWDENCKETKIKLSKIRFNQEYIQYIIKNKRLKYYFEIYKKNINN